MTDLLSLLDTPKKQSLQSQSASLRTSLKDFERAFAGLHDGRKPTRDEIRADEEIALQYKTYNRVRDVLAGRLTYEDFIAPAGSPAKKRPHRRVDSGTGCVPRKADYNGTPRKERRSDPFDLHETPSSVSPKPILLQAIGPTPQRDGKVLGLFDMSFGSAKSSQTPSSTSKKRKLDAIAEESPRKGSVPAFAQTPSQRRTTNQGDLLEFLCGTPQKTPQTGRCNRSRTPVSEGRKFLLSQFFATPCSVKHVGVEADEHGMYRTPLKDCGQGRMPVGKDDIQPQDATPAYLKRSASFKDRLLSAANPFANDGKMSSASIVAPGPPTLRHFRAAPKTFSQMMSDVQDNEADDNDDEDDDYDDDLEALREMEGSELNKDSERGTAAGSGPLAEAGQYTTKVWKKKGQKRTTRRSNMRPAFAKIAEAPKFVAPEDRDEHLDTSDQDFSDSDNSHHSNTKSAVKSSRAKASASTDNHIDASRNGGSKLVKKSSGTINPNAHSHMNFRTLKIRNKNSKAKGSGKGRFGRRR